MNVKPTPTDPATLARDAEWSRNLLNMLAIGGMWPVPRCGLIFRKKDERTLELLHAMPYLREMQEAAEAGHDVPKSREELIEYQLAEFDLIQNRFNLAGLKVLGREKIK